MSFRLAAPLVTFYDPNHIDTAKQICWHEFSTSTRYGPFGRDILTRLIYAIRPSLLYVLLRYLFLYLLDLF